MGSGLGQVGSRFCRFGSGFACMGSGFACGFGFDSGLVQVGFRLGSVFIQVLLVHKQNLNPP